jgi:hypothetical protein
MGWFRMVSGIRVFAAEQSSARRCTDSLWRMEDRNSITDISVSVGGRKLIDQISKNDGICNIIRKLVISFNHHSTDLTDLSFASYVITTQFVFQQTAIYSSCN